MQKKKINGKNTKISTEINKISFFDRLLFLLTIILCYIKITVYSYFDSEKAEKKGIINMKKIILISLSALLLLSSLTACGSKNNSDSSSNTYSRQLYNSDDTAVKSEEDEDEESDENTEGVSVDSRAESKEKKDNDKKTSGSDSSKSNTYTISANTSSKKTSSVASVKPAESSRTASSELIASRTESTTVSSEAESMQSSDEDTETTSDSELITDTESNDDTDSGIAADYFSESDLVCTYKGINIKAGSDINVLISQIGLPYNVDTEPNEDNEELVNKTYYFDGMEVKTNPNEDGSMDYIVSMKIDDESYKTVKGAKIGMDIDDVIEIYGEDYSIAYDMFQYEIDGMILGFDTDDGFVVSINYLYEKKDDNNDNNE